MVGRRCVWMFGACVSWALLAACDGGSLTDPEYGAIGRFSESATPSQVVASFLDAARGDPEDLERYLTRAARVEWKKQDGPKFRGDSLTGHVIGEESIEGSEAVVNARVSDDEQERSVRFRLRKENGAWRLCGMIVDLGGNDFDVDFEGKRDSMHEMGEAIAEGLAESMQKGIADWQAAKDAHDRARQIECYAWLEAISAPSSPKSGRSTSPRRVVPSPKSWKRSSMAPASHSSATGAEKALASEISLELEGASRVQAVETAAAHADLVPIYEIPQELGEGATASLRFEAGPRALPVTFAGPFGIETKTIEERAPHTTGKLTLTLFSLGLAPPALALMDRMAESLALEAVVDGEGRELRKAPDTRWMGTPTRRGSLTLNSYSFEMAGLLQGTRSIQSIHGRVLLDLPSKVQSVHFDSMERRESEQGGRTLRLSPSGKSLELRITSKESLESTTVRFAPANSAGDPLKIEFSSANAFGESLTANLQVEAPPASLSVKIVDQVEVEYSFDLRDVPLARWSEQPEELEKLRFPGAAPATIAFVRFVGEKNSNLPKVEIEIVNSSNKVIESASVQFEYRDRAGTIENDFPHSLTSSSFGPDGPEPFAPANATITSEVTAFFMPPETHSITVRIDTLKFNDGSTWSPPK